LARMRTLAADAFRCARPQDLGDLLDAIGLEIGLQGLTSPCYAPPELSAAVVVQQHAATTGAARA